MAKAPRNMKYPGLVIKTKSMPKSLGLLICGNVKTCREVRQQFTDLCKAHGMSAGFHSCMLIDKLNKTAIPVMSYVILELERMFEVKVNREEFDNYTSTHATFVSLWGHIIPKTEADVALLHALEIYNEKSPDSVCLDAYIKKIVLTFPNSFPELQGLQGTSEG